MTTDETVTSDFFPALLKLVRCIEDLWLMMAVIMLREPVSRLFRGHPGNGKSGIKKRRSQAATSFTGHVT